MPVKSDKVYKRKYRKLRTKWYNKKYSIGDIASKAFTGVKYLRGIINSELKSVTNTATSQAISYNGLVLKQTNISQGDTHFSREGNSVLAKYLTIKGTVSLAGTSNANPVSIYVVQDKRRIDFTTDRTLVASDMFENTGGPNAPNSMINVNAIGRFKILASKRFMLASGTSSQKQFEFNVKDINCHVKWQYNPGTGDLQNHIYLIALSDGIPSSGNEPILNYVGRFKYYDN